MAVTCKSVCYGCVPPTRFIGCHAVCPKYIEELNRRNAERSYIISEGRKYNAINSYCVEKAERNKRKYKRKK